VRSRGGPLLDRAQQRATSASAASKNPNIATLSACAPDAAGRRWRRSADDPIAAPGEQQLHLGVRKERVLFRVDPIVLAEPQRRYPVRVARVALVHVIDEPADLGAALDWANLQHGVLP
jgi:hypothetical protein